MSDSVYDPSHYHLPGYEIQCIDVCEALGLNAHTQQAFQYLWRAGRKEGGSERLDLMKARWYIDRRIAQLEPARGPDPGKGTVLVDCVNPSCPLRAEPHGHWKHGYWK